MKPSICALMTASILAAGAPLAEPNDTPPMPGSRAAPPAQTAPARTAEDSYNEGRGLAQRKSWSKAEEAYRDAIKLRRDFPEAWNGLGYVLRHQKKYDESVRAYQEALRLRPAFPEALEYLGEAYVQMGRLAEAESVLERLRPLDPKEAEALAKAIAAAKR